MPFLAALDKFLEMSLVLEAYTVTFCNTVVPDVVVLGFAIIFTGLPVKLGVAAA